MAKNQEDPSELLRQVEAELRGDVPARRSDRTPAVPAPSEGGPSRVMVALMAGGAAAGVVWLLFVLLPFFGALSGAAGAFLGAAAAALLLRRR